MKDREYITNKLRHMKWLGITCELNPETGAARPDWAKAETAEREKRTKRKKE
jgi:hypothetical protein